MVQYDVYITLIFYRYITKFVLFISIMLASCMVVGGAQSSDRGPNRNIRSMSGIHEGQGECSCCGNNQRNYCCRSYCDGKK